MFLDGGQANINYSEYQKKIIGSRKANNSSNSFGSNSNSVKDSRNSFSRGFDLFNKNKNKINTNQFNSIKIGLTKSINSIVGSVTAQLSGQKHNDNNKQISIITNNNNNIKKNNKISDKQQQPIKNLFFNNNNNSNRNDSHRSDGIAIRNRMHPFNRSMGYYNSIVNNTSGSSKNNLQRSVSVKQMKITTSNNFLIQDLKSKTTTTLNNKKEFFKKGNSNSSLLNSSKPLTRKKIVNNSGLRLPSSASFKQQQQTTKNKNNKTCQNNWLTKTTGVVFPIINLYLLLILITQSSITRVVGAPLPIVDSENNQAESIAFLSPLYTGENSKSLIELELNNNENEIVLDEDNFNPSFLLLNDDKNNINNQQVDDTSTVEQSASEQNYDNNNVIVVDNGDDDDDDKSQQTTSDDLVLSQESTSPSSNELDDGVDQELLWIQRRRLNRDRALEPPPWFREQPMRRGGSNALTSPSPSSLPASAYQLQSSTDGDDNQPIIDDKNQQQEEEKSQQQESSKKEANLVPREQSNDNDIEKMSKEKLFSEILNQFLLAASNDQDFLDEFYNEIQLRRKQQQQQLLKSNDRKRRALKGEEEESRFIDDNNPLLKLNNYVNWNKLVTPFDASKSFKQSTTMKQNKLQQSNSEDAADPNEQLELATIKNQILLLKPILIRKDILNSNTDLESNGFSSLDMEQSLLDKLDSRINKMMTNQDDARRKINENKSNNPYSNLMMKRSAKSNNYFNNNNIEADFYHLTPGLQQQQQQQKNTNQLQVSDSMISYADQLALAATKIKSYIEDKLDLHRGAIIGLYPLNSEKLLVKLNVKALNRYELTNMIENYGKFKFIG